MIELRDGTKKYNSNVVFEDASLAIEPGTYYTLTGPNGSGKSTLMNCLLRQEELTAGELLLNGKSVTAQNRDYAEQIFGINDSIGWLPGLTIGQHLNLLFDNALPLPNPLNTELFTPRQALEELGVPQAFDRQPYTLSSGQEQRSRLASLLVRPAVFYFLDEPEKRLDAAGVQWIRNWAIARVAEGAAVCIATHDEVLNAVPDVVSLRFPLNDSSTVKDDAGE